MPHDEKYYDQLRRDLVFANRHEREEKAALEAARRGDLISQAREKMMNDKRPEHTYIGIKPCGCIWFVAVDTPSIIITGAIERQFAQARGK